MWKQNQKRLDTWIDIKLIPRLTPTIFYIDWNWERSYPVSNAVMLKESIDITKNYYTFQKYIAWRDFKSKLLICGNFPKEQLQAPYRFYGNPRIRNKSFLKSHLQKCIRRCKDAEAVKTAFDLMQLDFLMFLRRIIIIMIEDVHLHQSISTICWMMVAYGENEWNPSKNHIEWLLGIVSLLSLSKFAHSVPRISIIDMNNYKSKLDSLYDKSKKRFTVLWCLLLRKSYGGMKCDMDMLNGAFTVWYDILPHLKKKLENQEIKRLFYIPVKAVSVALQSLVLQQYCLEAVDFHCYPEICNQLLYSLDEEYIEKNELDEEKLKSLIWKFNSKINVRTYIYVGNSNNKDKLIENIKKDENKIWDEIKDKYYQIAYEKLKHSYNIYS